jgi:hypothetical protein
MILLRGADETWVTLKKSEAEVERANALIPAIETTLTRTCSYFAKYVKKF